MEISKSTEYNNFGINTRHVTACSINPKAAEISRARHTDGERRPQIPQIWCNYAMVLSKDRLSRAGVITYNKRYLIARKSSFLRDVARVELGRASAPPLLPARGIVQEISLSGRVSSRREGEGERGRGRGAERERGESYRATSSIVYEHCYRGASRMNTIPASIVPLIPSRYDFLVSEIRAIYSVKTFIWSKTTSSVVGGAK